MAAHRQHTSGSRPASEEDVALTSERVSHRVVLGSCRGARQNHCDSTQTQLAGVLLLVTAETRRFTKRSSNTAGGSSSTSISDLLRKPPTSTRRL